MDGIDPREDEKCKSQASKQLRHFADIAVSWCANLVYHNLQGTSASLDFGPHSEFDCPRVPMRTI